MFQTTLNWLQSELYPLLEAWPQDSRIQLAAVLISCVLVGGMLAKGSMQLPFASRQGKIALSHVLFFVGGVSVARALAEVHWWPLFQGGLAALALSIPGYLLGFLAEKTEETVTRIGHDVMQRHGMRERVLEEIRQNKVDDDLYQQAQKRADGDSKRTHHYYIGLRSRKLARLEREKAQSQAPKKTVDDRRIDFELVDLEAVTQEGASTEDWHRTR